MRESVLFGSVGEKAEVTDAHKAAGQHVKQEAADEFLGIVGERFKPISATNSVPANSTETLAGEQIFPLRNIINAFYFSGSKEFFC